MPLPTIGHLRFAAPPRRTGESLRKPKPTEKMRSPTTVRPHVLSTLSDRRFGETPGPRGPREPSGGGAPRTSPRAGGSTSLGREVWTRRGFSSGNRRLRSINSCRFEARTAPETEDRRRRASEVAPRRRSPETEAGTGPPGSGHDPPRPGLVRTVPPGEARAVRVRSRREGAPSRRRYPSRATGGRAPPLEPHFTIDLRGPRPKPRTEHPFFLATGRSPPSNERRTRLLPQIDLFTGITRGKAGPRPSNKRRTASSRSLDLAGTNGGRTNTAASFRGRSLGRRVAVTRRRPVGVDLRSRPGTARARPPENRGVAGPFNVVPRTETYDSLDRTHG